MALITETVINPDTGEEETYTYEDGTVTTVDFTGGESQDYDLTEAEALAGQGFLQDERGNAYKLDDSGNLTFKDSTGTDFTYNTEKGGFTDKAGNFAGGDNALLSYVKKYGSKALDLLKTNGKFDPAKLLTAGIGAYKLATNKDEGGYNVPVPKMDAVREQIMYNDPNRRPGAAGRQYFTDPRFVKQGDAAALEAAKQASAAQAAGILAAVPKYTAPVNTYDTTMKMPWNPTEPAKTGTTTVTTQPVGLAAIPTKEQLMDPNYKIGMASGGIASARYLQGGTDGMADRIPANIDGKQPAALSHGEFVIPADVVSHLGNGNSEAGADKLYQMMSRIRKARTGNEKQGKKINPDKFMPGGLAAAYAGGGSVKGFNGTTGSAVSPTPTSAGGVPLDTSKTSTLSPWAGDYITNFLGQGAALANAPQQTYGGPLTAGASDLQQQGFAGISDVAAGGFQPTTFTSGTFGAAEANKYMNPYLMSALQPQIDEARRQSQITQMGNAAKMTQAGAFGGSRQAIMDAETQRALGANLAGITGAGYNKAYDTAMGQFNTEQGRGLDTQRATEASRQYSADYGLKSLSDLMSAGQTQRAIEGEGIAADKAQFEQQQAYPFNMVEFQRKLVEGLPTGASTTAVNQDAISKMQTDVAGLASLYKTLANLGIKTP